MFIYQFFYVFKDIENKNFLTTTNYSFLEMYYETKTLNI